MPTQTEEQEAAVQATRDAAMQQQQVPVPQTAASPRESMTKMAESPELATPGDLQQATDWFLNPEEDDDVASAVLPINVAPAGRPERVVAFTIQVIDRDELRRIRRDSERDTGGGIKETDEMEANLRIAVETLIDPNIKGDTRLRTVRGQQYSDPGDALRARFAHKPGIIDQIANKAIEISGYNSGDLKEIRAAGN